MAMRVRDGLLAALAFVVCMVTMGASGQASAPEAPVPQSSVATPLPPMPTPDPANFTAATPTKETVNGFLREFWGYDENRIWQVQAIQTTQVQGISRVTVLEEQKNAPKEQQQPSALVFLTLPDGKHLVTNNEILPFGARPFEDYRTILRRDAKGPSQGPANAQLLLVEFADFECPHCKEAQPTVDRLLKDFPQARYVAQPFPLLQIHSEAGKAADAGVCVAKLGGNEAYFKYSEAVYTNQASLTPEGSKQAIQGAVMAAGVDPTKVQACTGQPSTKAAVDDSLQLGKELGVNSTPTLFVNGRSLPFAGIPYDTLKQIVEYQIKLDGTGR